MANLSTVAPFGFDQFDPAQRLELFRRLGCGSCQYYRNTDQPHDAAKARQMVSDLGMSFDSVHGVFGPKHDPSSPDDKTRHAAVATYETEGQLAVEIGGSMVVVHPAPIADADASGYPVDRIDPVLRSMNELARIGERVGVTYLFENLPANYGLGANPRQLAQLIRRADHPRVRMCFDTGHARMTGGDEPVAEILRACADVVAYVHAHDNDGRADLHQMPGRGVIDWDAVGGVIRSLPAATPVMLEVFESESMIENDLSDGLANRLTDWMGVG